MKISEKQHRNQIKPKCIVNDYVTFNSFSFYFLLRLFKKLRNFAVP